MAESGGMRCDGVVRKSRVKRGRRAIALVPEERAWPEGANPFPTLHPPSSFLLLRPRPRERSEGGREGGVSDRQNLACI